MNVRVWFASSSIAFVGCASGSLPPAPAPVAEAPPSLEVRCGVDDHVRPGTELVDDVLVELVQPAPPLDVPAVSDAFASCGSLAHHGDDGEFSLAYLSRADGTVASAGPKQGRVFTPLARCAAEVMCHQRPASPNGEVRLRVTLRGRGPVAANVVVSSNEQVPRFTRDLLSTAASEAAMECTASVRVTPPARVGFVVDVHTGRDLTSFRRKGKVTGVRSESNAGVSAQTVACIGDKLATVSWGDRHAPAGDGVVRLDLSWATPAPVAAEP